MTSKYIMIILVFCSKQVFYGVRLYSSNNSLSFKGAIEIATSIKVYTGKEVSDNTRLHDPKIGYFGPVRKQTLDSWLVNIGQITRHCESSGDSIDGMVFFHNDFKPLIHNKTTSEDLKDATDCFKELDNHFSPNGQGENLSQFLEGMKVGTISGLEVATLYYQDWKKINEIQNLYSYIQENRSNFQPIIHHDYYHHDTHRNSVKQDDHQVVIKTLGDIKENDGLTNIRDHYTQEIKRLKNLRFQSKLIVAVSLTMFLLSSAICVISTLEQAGKISSHFFSIDKGFSLSTNIIILSSIALFIFTSLLVAGFTSNRASKKTEEVNGIEKIIAPSKILAETSAGHMTPPITAEYI